MVTKLNPHYSFTTPATVHDEEALTALELAGRIGQKVNEIIDQSNKLDGDMRDWADETTNETIPQAVEEKVKDHITNGDFDEAINGYAGDLKQQLAHLIGSVDEGTTSGDAELIDARLMDSGVKYPYTGENIRAVEQTRAAAPMKKTPIALDVADGYLFNIHDGGAELVGNGQTARYDFNGEKVVCITGYSWAWNAYPSFVIYAQDGTRSFYRFAGEYKADRNFLLAVPSNAAYMIINGRADACPIELYACEIMVIDDFVRTLDALNVSQFAEYKREGGMSECRYELTAENTTKIDGYIYDAHGTPYQLDGYSTLYARLPHDWKTVTPTGYNIGVNGGVFLTAKHGFISSFSTAAPAHLEPITIPENAEFIAFSVKDESLYNEIMVGVPSYTLDGLHVRRDQMPGYISTGVMQSRSITLSADNTDMISGRIYAYDGLYIYDATDYSTLILPLDPDWKTIRLHEYNVGVDGGAFIAADKKTPLQGIHTNYPYHLDKITIPEGACYVAISVKNANPYHNISVETECYELDGLRTPNAYAPWAGKKVVWIGTSIPYGEGSEKSYALEAANALGFNLIPAVRQGVAIHTDNGAYRMSGSICLAKTEYAAQGVTITSAPAAWTPNGQTNNYYTTYENIFSSAHSDADLFVFDVAPNNGNFALTDWEKFNPETWSYSDGSGFADHRNTFIGALLFLLNRMWEVNPKARAVFALASSLNYENGLENFRLLSDAFRIPIIDVWGKSMSAPPHINHLFVSTTDHHLNTYCHERFGRMFAGELMTIA